MIRELGILSREMGSKVFFYAQMDKGPLWFSYRQTRYAACALARELEKRGIGEGSYVACNLYNGPEFVFLALAAAYGGFTLAALNPRLSDEERLLRKIELENAARSQGFPAVNTYSGDRTQAEFRVFIRPQSSQAQQAQPASTSGESTKAQPFQAGIEVLDEAAVGRMFLEATGMRITEFGQQEGMVEMTSSALEIFDDATKREECFDVNRVGIIMFTSGTSGTPKATELTWAEIAGAARAANQRLSQIGKGVWQLVLPMCHIGGFQVMVRSLLNKNPFILYQRYQPQLILNDVLSYRVTHISVVDKMLVDLLESDNDRIISQYHCILLGGAALNNRTIRKALRAKAKVYASYGMTETSSMIAVEPISRGFDGALTLLPGYEVRIMKADEDGIGQLHVKGPGVFKGYLNARSSFTIDGWFVTGDRARFNRGSLVVFERTDDLIVSGGENIYPAEVRNELLRVPGIKDAAVFGTADETWGYRPVAFVEADYSEESIQADCDMLGLVREKVSLWPARYPQYFAREIHDYLENRMSRLHHPKHIFVLDELPRTAAGKTDVQALRQRYDRRIDIKKVIFYRVKQPFVKSIVTAKTTLDQRESFFVEVQDWAGRTGIGECVAFDTNWYLPETLEPGLQKMKKSGTALLLKQRYLHPSEISQAFAAYPSFVRYPMARASVEMAAWDLYGKIVGKPLFELIGGNPSERMVPGGVVVGIMSDEDTLAAVDKAVQAGYKRVKIKISPDSAVEKVAAVRKKYPDLAIFLDANQSFTEEHLNVLHKFDALDITCIEEPLNPEYVTAKGKQPLLERLSNLQENLQTPLCLDESLRFPEDYAGAKQYENLRCFVVKIGKLGGIQPTLDFITWAKEHQVNVWMGGMYDTGVSKRMHAAFETLPAVSLAGDLSDYSEYYEQDCAQPAFMCTHGMIELNPRGYEAGLGCELNKEYLKRCEIETFSVEK